MRIDDIVGTTIKSNNIEDNKGIITDPSPRLITLRLTDFDRFIKLPLSASLLCRLALKESISFDDLSKIIFNMHDKTLVDFVYTNPCGLRDVYELYITYGQEVPDDARELVKNKVIEERAENIRKRIDYISKLLSASAMISEASKNEIRQSISILEDDLMDYMFPF